MWSGERGARAAETSVSSAVAGELASEEDEDEDEDEAGAGEGDGDGITAGMPGAESIPVRTMAAAQSLMRGRASGATKRISWAATASMSASVESDEEDEENEGLLESRFCLRAALRAMPALMTAISRS
jgi:hypothetical protein